MNELTVFENKDFGRVRTTMKDGQPWFVAADVCRALEIGNPTMAMSRLDNDERMTLNSTDPHSGQRGGAQMYNLVNEPGLYSLVLGSRKPEAKAFKRWITHEVIPTIRKTGGYVNNDDLFINTYLLYADGATKELFRSTLGTIRSLNAKIEADKPKVLFADAVSTAKTSILVGELAKVLRQNGVDMGQNRLFTWLRDNGYLIKRQGSDYNMPTQRSMEMGLFEIKETAITHADGHNSVTKTVRVTGKGQQYFLNKFLGPLQ